MHPSLLEMVVWGPVYVNSQLVQKQPLLTHRGELLLMTSFACFRSIKGVKVLSVFSCHINNKKSYIKYIYKIF